MSESRTVANVEQVITSKWKDFAALIKIGIVNSNLITTFAGVWLALIYTNQRILANLDLVLFAVLGSGLIIAGSCSLNNYIDRDIDRIMDRTKERPTVTGNFSTPFVLTIGISFVMVGLLLLFFTNIISGILGIIGVISYVVIYSIWSKRRYVSNTVIGSISGAMPPLIGWAAVDPSLPALSWLLFLVMFIWQPPHFYALAMRRVEEYRKASIPMLPVVKGNAVTKLHILIWIILLFPIPFFMKSLGPIFMIIATLLNLGWLMIGLKGYRKNDDMKWATNMFVYSLNYLTIFFTAVVIFSVL